MSGLAVPTPTVGALQASALEIALGPFLRPAGGNHQRREVWL
jgi:hypothetical protein